MEICIVTIQRGTSQFVLLQLLQLQIHHFWELQATIWQIQPTCSYILIILNSLEFCAVHSLGILFQNGEVTAPLELKDIKSLRQKIPKGEVPLL